MFVLLDDADAALRLGVGAYYVVMITKRKTKTMKKIWNGSGKGGNRGMKRGRQPEEDRAIVTGKCPEMRLHNIPCLSQLSLLLAYALVFRHILQFFGLRGGQQEAQPQRDGSDASVQMDDLPNENSTAGNPNPNEPQPSETVTGEDGAQEVIEHSHHEDTEDPAPENISSDASDIVSGNVRDSYETERIGDHGQLGDITRGSYKCRDDYIRTDLICLSRRFNNSSAVNRTCTRER